MPRFGSSEVINQPDHFAEPDPEEVSKGLDDLKKFLTQAQNSAHFVLVLQHWEIDEIKKGEAKPGNALIHKLCESLGISSIQLESILRVSLERGENPYHDNIHPNQIGQKWITKTILEAFPYDSI